jgi:hypothetical protein
VPNLFKERPVVRLKEIKEKKTKQRHAGEKAKKQSTIDRIARKKRLETCMISLIYHFMKFLLPNLKQ